MKKIVSLFAAFVFFINQSFALAPSQPSSPIIGAVRALGESHIPFILPSSGTMGNNGALTLTTALPLVYASAYVYMPAGAISSGSAAGLYYGTCSSTTVCTLYNNTYNPASAPGAPLVPAAPTPFVTTGPGAYTQTISTNFAIFAMSVPGNTIGPNGTIRVSGVITTINNSDTKTFLAGYGTSFTFGTMGLTTSVTGAFSGGFSNRGVTNIQIPLANNLSFQITSSATTLVLGANDTTAAQSIGTYFKIAVATDYIVLENLVVELIPGV